VIQAHWDSYEAAIVEIVLGAGRIRLEPRPRGSVEGGFPFPENDSVFVVTAFNPRHATHLTAGQNRARQDDLEHELAGRGSQWLRAWGGNAEWTHVEDSAAILDMTERDALDLGWRFGQDAIFAWTAAAWTLLPCDDRPRTVMGWHVNRLPGP
jgi:Protein of unknown function (DUF3293)